MYRQRRHRRPAVPVTPPPVYGPHRLPDRVWVERFVRNHTDAHTPEGRALRAEVIEWICATGDCLLHAVWEVRRLHGMDGRCFCRGCDPEADVRGYGGVVVTR